MLKPTFDNVLLSVEEEKKLIIVEEKDASKKILIVKDTGKDVKEIKKGMRVWLGAFCQPAEVKIDGEVYIVCKQDDIICTKI